MNNYKIKVVCDNCKKEQEIAIPCGIRICDYLYLDDGQNSECKFCKCGSVNPVKSIQKRHITEWLEERIYRRYF